MISETQRQRMLQHQAQREHYLAARRAPSPFEPGPTRPLLVHAHPANPILAAVPLGALALAGLFGLLHPLTGAAIWGQLTFWIIPAGVVSGVVVAAAALYDWLALPAVTRARGVGFWFATATLATIALFSAAWLESLESPGDPSATGVVLAFTGTPLALLSGLLLGELHDRFSRFAALSGSPVALSRAEPASPMAEPVSLEIDGQEAQAAHA